MHLFDDPGQPYSCSQWGEQHDQSAPIIIHDGDNTIIGDMFKLFDSSRRPYTVFIDHEMKIDTLYTPDDGYCDLNCAKNAINPMLTKIETIEPDTTEIDLSVEIVENYIREYNLVSLYPNPFNPKLSIIFYSPITDRYQIRVLDIAGTYIETIFSGVLQPGRSEFSWNAKSMHSGVYLIEFRYSNKTLIEKVILLK